MDIEFNSQEELYIRVKPALKSKVNKLKRHGIKIDEIELWNFLSDKVFKTSTFLTLADIVSIIMHINADDLN